MPFSSMIRHPSLAVVELMRTLVDEAFHELGRGLGDYPADHGVYEPQRCCRKHSSDVRGAMSGRVLPDISKIVYEINRAFLGEVALRHPGDVCRLQRMSIVQDLPQQKRSPSTRP